MPVDVYVRLSAERSVKGLEHYNQGDLISINVEIRRGILLLVISVLHRSYVHFRSPRLHYNCRYMK